MYACFQILFPRYQKKAKLHSTCAKQKSSRNIVNCAWTWKLSEVLDTFFPVYISNISFGLVYCASPRQTQTHHTFLGRKKSFCMGGQSALNWCLPNPQIQWFSTRMYWDPWTLGRGIASNKSTWGVGGNGSNIKSLELSRTLEAAKGLELPPAQNEPRSQKKGLFWYEWLVFQKLFFRGHDSFDFGVYECIWYVYINSEFFFGHVVWPHDHPSLVAFGKETNHLPWFRLLWQKLITLRSRERSHIPTNMTAGKSSTQKWNSRGYLSILASSPGIIIQMCQGWSTRSSTPRGGKRLRLWG